MSYLLDHPMRVLALAVAHATLVGGALLVAILVALPFSLAVARRPRASIVLLGVLGALYTIPSLALLAVLVEWIGLGDAPIFVALVFYAQFMLARNAIAGITGIDGAQIDSATGLGMSRVQRLLQIELPQALPVMLGGVRVAAIAMIAIATLGGYVGGGGLGVLIFNGLTLHNTGMIVAGSIGVCALAIAIDLALRTAERLISV